MIEIKQAPLNEQLKKEIFAGFAEHSIDKTGIDGLMTRLFLLYT